MENKYHLDALFSPLSRISFTTLALFCFAEKEIITFRSRNRLVINHASTEMCATKSNPISRNQCTYLIG